MNISVDAKKETKPLQQKNPQTLEKKSTSFHNKTSQQIRYKRHATTVKVIYHKPS
jgi:hypothetical protein